MEHEIKIVLRSDIKEIASLRGTVHDICIRMGFCGHDASLVVTAVWEAALNAATHGSPNGAADSIKVTIKPANESIYIDITSRDAAFDLPSPKPAFSLTSKRGRGLPLIYAFMDEVKLTRQADCVTLHLIKHLPSP